MANGEKLSAEEAALRLQVKIGGLYRHYKTKDVYRVVTIAKNTETLEDEVIYESHLHTNPLSDVWARPIKMFLNTAEVDGVTVPRFSLEE